MSENRTSKPKWIEIMGPYLQLGSVLVALAALAFAWQQNQSDSADRARTKALDYYKSYLQLALQNSDLASPKENLVDVPKYWWFVTYMLSACEQILDNYPNDVGWTKSCQSQFDTHSGYLCRMEQEEIKNYSDSVQKMIRKVKVEKKC